MITWNILNNIEQLEELKAVSYQKPIAIFKHSTTCGISHSVKHNIEKNADELLLNQLDFYYLDLLTYRSISNQIADMFDVIHQSPQLIVLKNETVVYHSSHYGIDLNKVLEHLDKE